MTITIDRLPDFLGNASNEYRLTADDPDSIERLSLLNGEGRFQLDDHNYQGSIGGITKELDPSGDLIKWTVTATRILADNS